MMRGWLEDVADRLEAAAELARELLTAPGLVPPPVRVRIDFLAERLWQVAQRLGILGSLGSEPGAQVVHALCDLYRVARRAAGLAQADGHGAVGEGLGAIASELHIILAELAALDGGRPGGGDRDPPVDQRTDGRNDVRHDRRIEDRTGRRADVAPPWRALLPVRGSSARADVGAPSPPTLTASALSGRVR